MSSSLHHHHYHDHHDDHGDESQAERKMMAAGITGPEGHAMAHPEVIQSFRWWIVDEDFLISMMTSKGANCAYTAHPEVL